MVEQRLREAGIELPLASTPAANYIPWMVVGRLLFVAGQIPVFNGERRHIGKVGLDLAIPHARDAAQLCGMNLLAQAKSAVGDLDRIARVVKLGGFVNCTPEFDQHPQVINAASELMILAFGEAGRHTRTAVGAPSLPFGVSVEIDAIFELHE
jgi:enamine deaminase RidA (YjgF/YER057c/UK114 family)